MAYQIGIYIIKHFVTKIKQLKIIEFNTSSILITYPKFLMLIIQKYTTFKKRNNILVNRVNRLK